MDERAQKAFDFASEVTKQLIALSTGIIALTISFVHDYASGASTNARWELTIGWGFFLLSVVFGILTLMALAGHLGETKAITAKTIYACNVKVFAAAQVLSFLTGLLLTIIFGFHAIMTATGQEGTESGKGEIQAVLATKAPAQAQNQASVLGPANAQR